MSFNQNEASASTAEDDPGYLSHRQILVVLSGLMAGMFLAALDQSSLVDAYRMLAGDRADAQLVKELASVDARIAREAAAIAAAEVTAGLASAPQLRHVIFCCFDEATADAYREALANPR